MKGVQATALIAALWGEFGVFALLAFAIWRILPHSLELATLSMTMAQKIMLIAFCIFMAYSEGYRGFQKQFSPRVAARLRHLLNHSTVTQRLFAPAFCLCLFDARPKRLVTSYSLILGIWLLVYLVYQLEQPWRGIIDTGVMIGLLWGVLSMGYFVIQAFTSETFIHSAELKG